MRAVVYTGSVEQQNTTGIFFMLVSQSPASLLCLTLVLAFVVGSDCLGHI